MGCLTLLSKEGGRDIEELILQGPWTRMEAVSLTLKFCLKPSSIIFFYSSFMCDFLCFPFEFRQFHSFFMSFFTFLSFSLISSSFFLRS